MAAAVLGALGTWWVLRSVDLRSGPPAVADAVPPSDKQATLRDVESLRSDVEALAHQLDDLRRRADLLDARKKADALMARLVRVNESSGH
jgi:hypothetical protein